MTAVAAELEGFTRLLQALEPYLKVEFLAAQHGPEHRRDGTRNVTVDAAGVTAQRLRFVDILFAEPWSVRLADANGFPLGAEGLAVPVANPVAYVVQKLAVLPRRTKAKQPKDLLYVHDTLELFGGALPALHEVWIRLRPGLVRGAVKAISAGRDLGVGSVTDLHREAARIAAATGRPSPPTPDLIRRRCQLGLEALLGG